MIRQNFVVTIGDFGSSVTLHDSSNVKDNLFLENLSEETKQKLRNLFNNYSSTPIYIILDTLDQTYKKKTYPLIGKNDLDKIAKKEIEIEGNKNGLHGYISYIPTKNSDIKKLECLYVSASKSELLNEWVELLLDLNNHLVGIYMMPIESFSLLEEIKKINSKSKKSEYSKKEIYCLILQTKIGGTRQIIFSDHGIIFTRIVNYNFQESDWNLRYEQDVYSTLEYLKRSYVSLNVQDLRIINVLPKENIEKITLLNNKELNLTNYTPKKLSEEIGYKNLLSDQELFCDLLISKIFSQKSKKLRFTLPKIEALDKIFLVLKLSKILYIVLAVLIAITSFLVAFSAYKINYQASDSQKQKLLALSNYNNALSLSNESEKTSDIAEGLNINQIMDFGKIDENLRIKDKDFIAIYNELKFLKKYNVQLEKFSYFLIDFNQKAPSSYLSYQFGYNGNLNNKSGDIDDLFKDFDIMSNSTKKYFSEYQIEYKEIPKTIDFTQKYYTFPIEFTFKK